MYTYSHTRTLALKVICILALFSAAQVAPPAHVEGPNEEPIVQVGPKAVQASGFPTIDIGQIFGHIGSFAQGLDQIASLREKYELIRSNFKRLANITGWDPLDNFFKPIDDFLQNNFDPMFAVARAGYNAWEGMRDTYYDFKQNAGSGSLKERAKQAGKFTVEMAKDVFTDPAKTDTMLADMEDKIDKAQQCIEEAKGNMSMNNCISHIQSLGVQQMGRVERAIAKQSALIAAQGLNDKTSERHRQKLLDVLVQENADFTLTTVEGTPAYNAIDRKY
jgi:hypothetical protein